MLIIIFICPPLILRARLIYWLIGYPGLVSEATSVLIICLYVAESLEQLDREVAEAVSYAWSSNTLATRNSQWKKFITFCANNGLQPVPADHRTVCRFLVWLARNAKFLTVNNYLSAICVLHKYYDFDVDYRDSFLIKLVL